MKKPDLLAPLTFDEILAIFSRKQPPPLDKQGRMAKSRRRMKTWRRHQDAARDIKAAVAKMVEGPPQRARPGAAAHLTGPVRWLGLLGAMADREWTLRELCASYDRPRNVTLLTVDRMVKRGFVEKRPNPDMRPARSQTGRADLWLYRQTESGSHHVASLPPDHEHATTVHSYAKSGFSPH
jgi:hypothetical protein